MERGVAAALCIPVTRVQSVVQFYSFLYDRPRGRYRILFSDNITDRMLGNSALIEHMLKRLKLQRGQTSADGAVSVDTTSCTGMCDQGPAMLVNNRAVTRLTSRRIDEICELIRSGAPIAEWPAEFFRVDDNIRRRETLLTPIEPGAALDAAIARGRAGVMDEIKRSKLRGRGGAGFPTGTKFGRRAERSRGGEIHRLQRGRGRAGTFKDRVLLNSYAVRVLEGMAIAGFAVGSTKGLSTFVGNTGICSTSCRPNSTDAPGAGRLGNGHSWLRGVRFRHRDPHGRGRLHLRRGHGAGRIARRKARPPACTSALHGPVGYLGKPTVVDNVESARACNGDRPRRRRQLREARHAHVDRHEAHFRFGRLPSAGCSTNTSSG